MNLLAQAPELFLLLGPSRGIHLLIVVLVCPSNFIPRLSRPDADVELV